jgi:hypothetical protein
MNPSGADLRPLPHHLGGHPEWADGRRLIGRDGDWQTFYDTDRMEFAGRIGDPEILPNPEGDIAVSPDARWLVNGYRRGTVNAYVFFRLADGAHTRFHGFDVSGWTSGKLRLDPAPCWNRSSNAVLVPGIADDEAKSRQLFVLRLVE